MNLQDINKILEVLEEDLWHHAIAGQKLLAKIRVLHNCVRAGILEEEKDDLTR